MGSRRPQVGPSKAAVNQGMLLEVLSEADYLWESVRRTLAASCRTRVFHLQAAPR